MQAKSKSQTIHMFILSTKQHHPNCQKLRPCVTNIPRKKKDQLAPNSLASSEEIPSTQRFPTISTRFSPNCCSKFRGKMSNFDPPSFLRENPTKEADE